MKNLLPKLALCALSFSVNVAFAQVEDAARTTTASVSREQQKASLAKDLSAEPIMQARRQVMTLLSTYASADTTLARMESKTASKGVINDQEFADYVNKMQKNLQRRLAKLEERRNASMDYLLERSQIMRGLSFLRSAVCLSNSRSDDNLVETKDLDGNQITAFSLALLRNNARYGFIEPYREGFARIKKDQVYGYLNMCGDEVIQCQYETAEPFNNGKALVKKVDWYFADLEGNESEALANVINAKSFRDGISIVTLTNGKQALIDNYYDSNQRLLSNQYDAIDFFGQSLTTFKVRNGKKYGLIALNGEQKLEVAYDRIEPSNLEGMYQIEQEGKLGLMDTALVIRFKPAFQQLSGFNEYGVALAKEGTGYRLIDRKTLKSSKSYEYIGQFDAFGLAPIRSEAKRYGLIDSNLNVVLEPTYANLGGFNLFGLAPVCKEETDKCGYIDIRGKEIVSATYHKVSEFNKHGLATVTATFRDCPEAGKECKSDMVVDYRGKVIITAGREANPQDVIYIVVDSIHNERYTPVMVRQGKKSLGYHLVDKDLLKLVTSTPYEAIGPVDVNGLMAVAKGELWGLMDTAGKMAIRCMYKEIRKPGDGYYGVKNAENDKFGYISAKGKIQIPFEYDDVKSFRGGYAAALKGKGWGLINKFNAKVVPCAFKSINSQGEKYEIIGETDTYIMNSKGDCEQNCEKFEIIRKRANTADPK